METVFLFNVLVNSSHIFCHGLALSVFQAVRRLRLVEKKVLVLHFLHIYSYLFICSYLSSIKNFTKSNGVQLFLAHPSAAPLQNEVPAVSYSRYCFIFRGCLYFHVCLKYDHKALWMPPPWFSRSDICFSGLFLMCIVETLTSDYR